MQSLNLFESLQYSVVGLLTVFAVLCVLYIVIMIESKIVGALTGKGNAPTVQATAVSEPSQNVSDDGVRLINVDDESAAMIMAIVADTSGIPLEELYFKTIKAAEDK